MEIFKLLNNQKEVKHLVYQIFEHKDGKLDIYLQCINKEFKTKYREPNDELLGWVVEKLLELKSYETYMIKQMGKKKC